MKKLFLRIILVFVVITVIVGFFVGDYVSKESSALWDKHKEKPAEVTAQVITEENNTTQDYNASLSEDDKDPQVLRLETLASADKQITFVTSDDASVSTTLETLTEIFKRPKSVKPYTSDCGVEDASIVEFNNIQFKKDLLRHQEANMQSLSPGCFLNSTLAVYEAALARLKK